ncbi:MAG: 5-bromo-4-chloroindolyl phosphate hydrolysis family protein [Oscillospiraceae bacterium]|jgi:hypothetical protein|nr:5-bromo-4-chloroindolyl phosphate hydrolysis family protein [Oscillospiraceae bacterium]
MPQKDNQKQKKRKGSVVPIYLAAAVFAVTSLSEAVFVIPISLPWWCNPWILSVAAWLLGERAFRGKPELPEHTEDAVGAETREAAEPINPELDALLKEGNLALSEMGRIRRSILDKDVEVKICKIEEITGKILANAKEDARDIPKTRKFLKYYLPTTLKLLNAYDRMAVSEVDGQNVSGTVKRIEDLLDDIIAAYNKQLDAMFSDDALDIETDIRVMENQMRNEGLL